MLTLESTATEDKLLFSPTRGGEIELPDIMRFFLSRLGWSIEPGVDLEAVVDAAEMSQGDWDWSRFFGNLLPDPLPSTTADLSAFAAAIGAALDTALQELTRERAFYLTFAGLGVPNQAIAGVVWDYWFTHPTLNLDPIEELPSLLLELIDLPDAQFAEVAASLMSRQISLPNFCEAFLSSWASAFDIDFDRHLDAWLGTISGGLETWSMPRTGEFTDALFSKLNSPQLPDLGTLRDPGDFDLLDIRPASFQMETREIIFAKTAEGKGSNRKAQLASTGTRSEFTGEWSRFFAKNYSQSGSLSREKQAPLLAQAMTTISEASGTDRQKMETLLMHTVAKRSEGIMLALASMPAAAQRVPSIVWKHLTTHVEQSKDWNVKKLLDKPGTVRAGIQPDSQGTSIEPRDRGRVKYLIFSDLHRDDPNNDDKGPFKAGSIDHFKSNANLYCRILDWADQEGYTVLEAGDCEELWFDIEQLVASEPRARQVQEDPASLLSDVARHLRPPPETPREAALLPALRQP